MTDSVLPRVKVGAEIIMIGWWSWQTVNAAKETKKYFQLYWIYCFTCCLVTFVLKSHNSVRRQGYKNYTIALRGLTFLNSLISKWRRRKINNLRSSIWWQWVILVKTLPHWNTEILWNGVKADLKWFWSASEAIWNHFEAAVNLFKVKALQKCLQALLFL